jgi:hypothetical protein
MDEFEYYLDNKVGTFGDMRLLDMLYYLLLLDKFLKENQGAQTLYNHMINAPFNLVLESAHVEQSQMVYTLQANLFTLSCAILHLSFQED